MRYFFEISYNGSRYNGWQSQPNAVGVQSVVEQALLKISGRIVEIVGSGRTDTGVHCEQQFFHCDLDEEIDGAKFLYRLNAVLPGDIAIARKLPVKEDAHARFDAVARSYRYHIHQRKNPFLTGLSWFFFRELDIRTMNEAAALLVGRQDFKSFSKVKTDVNNFFCEVTEARWKIEGNDLQFEITANRFLRGMVRAIVGTLVEVGLHKISPEDFSEILKKQDRKEAAANVPPHGLYLTSVRYPEEIFL